MILKRLREGKNFSQEQLALMAGLNVRTIQRIESGKSASIESLKSLAAVLEVNVETLQQEIYMIDKNSIEWKSLPLWFRIQFIGSEYIWLGLAEKKYWIRAEKLSAAVGLIFLVLTFVQKDFGLAGLFLLVCAYAISLITRVADSYSIW